jgi:GST-like protein
MVLPENVSTGRSPGDESHAHSATASAAMHDSSARRGAWGVRRRARVGARKAIRNRRRLAVHLCSNSIICRETSSMSDATDYTPPKVWTWQQENGGQFASINRPIAGPTHERSLPVGQHPLQLYSQGTPNGVKVTVMLEELLALGHTGAEYDAWLIRIGDGDQFSTGFVAINPNSKIPALVDYGGPSPIRVFESGSILLYLAEKFGALLPQAPAERAETLNWLFWQMGAGPFLGGGFGHFYHYAPWPQEYPINRYAMEVKRQLDVLDRQLAEREYLAGDGYTIADIATWPWYGNLVLHNAYDAAEFLQVHAYRHVLRWARQVAARPAVVRGRLVNSTGEGKLRERHDASDFAAVLARAAGG